MERLHVYAHVYLCTSSVLYSSRGPIIVTYAVHCRILRSDSTLIMSMLEKSSAEIFQCCGTISLSCLEESFFLCCVSVFSIYSVLCRVVLGLEVGIVDEDTMRCFFKNQKSLSHCPFVPKRKAFTDICSNGGFIRSGKSIRRQRNSNTRCCQSFAPSQLSHGPLVA